MRSRGFFFLRCGTRPVRLRTRHTFSGAARFTFGHLLSLLLNPRGDWALNPKWIPANGEQSEACPRAAWAAGEQLGLFFGWLGQVEDVRTNSAAWLSAAAAPCTRPLRHARTLRGFTFYWTERGRNQGRTFLSGCFMSWTQNIKRKKKKTRLNLAFDWLALTCKCWQKHSFNTLNIFW